MGKIAMDEKILMLNASIHDEPLIQAAKRLGYYVITTSNRPHYPGHKYSARYLYGDYSKIDDMIAIVEQHSISAVCCGTSDNTAIMAAQLGEYYGWPGHDSIETTLITHRKRDFKEFVRANGIKSPIAKSYSSIDGVLADSKTFQYPIMVKPDDAAGGQGVSKVSSSAELRHALETCFGASRDGSIVIEPFIEGKQFTFLTFLVSKKVRAWCTWSDHAYLDPYMVSGGVLPSDVPSEVSQKMVLEVQKIADKLDLVDGPLNAQFIIRDGEPWIIEIMRRSPGNWTTSLASKAMGIDWNEWIIRAEVGLDCSGMPNGTVDGYWGYAVLLANHAGTFCGIRADAEIVGNIDECVFWQGIGHIIENEMSDKLGIVHLRFSSREEAEIKMRNFYSLISVEVL